MRAAVSLDRTLRYEGNLLPRVFVPYCSCWLDETSNRWSRGTKTLGMSVLQGEKNQRKTVSFSIEHARPCDTYVKTSNGITSFLLLEKNQQQDDNENVNETIASIRKTITVEPRYFEVPREMEKSSK